MNGSGCHRRSGFTLVEMLCVVAIIGILAALLLPALNRGKLEAKRADCANNLRQIGIAFQVFAQDHEDKYPINVPVADGGAAGQTAVKVFQTLESTLVKPIMVTCPADMSHSAANDFEHLGDANISFFVAVDAVQGEATRALSGDRNLVVDGHTMSTLTTWPTLQRARWSSSQHQYKGNVLYADGHVDLTKNLPQAGGSSSGSTSGGSGGSGGGTGGGTGGGNGPQGGNPPGNSGSPSGGGSPGTPNSPAANQPSTPSNSPPSSPGGGRGGSSTRPRQARQEIVYTQTATNVIRDRTTKTPAMDTGTFAPDPVMGMSQFDQNFNKSLLNLVLWGYPILLLLLLLLLAYYLWRKHQERQRRKEQQF